MGKETQIQLDADAALVLFELLARSDETDRFEFEDAAETQAMVLLHGALERALVEPFHPDYKALVQAARARIRKRAGVE